MFAKSTIAKVSLWIQRPVFAIQKLSLVRLATDSLLQTTNNSDRQAFLEYCYLVCTTFNEIHFINKSNGGKSVNQMTSNFGLTFKKIVWNRANAVGSWMGCWQLRKALQMKGLFIFSGSKPIMKNLQARSLKNKKQQLCSIICLTKHEGKYMLLKHGKNFDLHYKCK